MLHSFFPSSFSSALSFSCFSIKHLRVPSEKQNISEQMNEKQRNVLLIYLSKSIFREIRVVFVFQIFIDKQSTSYNNTSFKSREREKDGYQEKCFVLSISKGNFDRHRTINCEVFVVVVFERPALGFYTVQRIDLY